MKSYKPWTPEQAYLLPPSPREWLPEDHLAYFILDLVSELDLTMFDSVLQSRDHRGERPYAPRAMVALILYAYSIGVFSSRKVARSTYEDVAFRVIAGNCHPHFTRISAFRRAHLEALRGLFLQVLKLCQRAGMVKLGHVAIDGTKIQANASKHKAMSYDRMSREEERLSCEISDLFELADQLDVQEDQRYGEEDPLDLPAELKRREDRLAKIREAKSELEGEALKARERVLREQAERHQEAARAQRDEVERKRAQTRAQKRTEQADRLRDEIGFGSDRRDEPVAGALTSQGLATHRVPHTRAGQPKPFAQRNFTDADSRIMERDSTFLQGYNCQLAVDEHAQVIVAHAVTHQAPDTQHFRPMLQQAVNNCGCAPKVATADAGYWREGHAAFGDELGTDVLIALQPAHRPSLAQIADPKEQSARICMARKLTSRAGTRAYARRKATVEPVYGQIKEVRRFRRFSLRGLPSAIGEWAVICTTHNLLELFRFERASEESNFARA